MDTSGGGGALRDPFERPPQREEPMRVARRDDPEPGLVLVDATWGTITPLQVHPEVRTVGELEVIEHLREGGPAVDTRREEYVEQGTIPGAVPIPHEEMRERRGELATDRPTVFFCNGPQYSATPHAIEELLEAGHPAELILFYRGGMHDWVTLGLPVV